MCNIILTETSSPNFIDEKGQVYLVRCPECKKENYSANVASGICTWCSFDLNKSFKSIN